MFPRAPLPQVNARCELAQTGLHWLMLGPPLGGEGAILYVGEGDSIRPRAVTDDAHKDFWTRAIGFTTMLLGSRFATVLIAAHAESTRAGAQFHAVRPLSASLAWLSNLTR